MPETPARRLFYDYRVVTAARRTTTGELTIKGNNNQCVKVVGAAYLTINKEAIVTLQGIGFDADGQFQRSVIENDGATLRIIHSGKAPCRFSNEKGPPVVSAGILVNRDNGLTEIWGADFVDSSARPFRGHGSKGGAITVVSGDVAIMPSPFRTRFSNDTADLGGAIFVDRDATLNIDSTNFQFINNRADQGGGAIFSNGVVNIRRGTGTFKGAPFTHNHAQNGGAIYSDGGQLSVDGVDFDHNQSKHDGGAVVSNELEGKVASIANSYFRGNSAKENSGALYVVEGSGMKVRRSTFSRDRAGQHGGGIFANGTDELTSNLKVVNSTFVGGGHGEGDEGVVTNDASGEVVFSTLQGANLASFGAQGQVSVSNSNREPQCRGAARQELRARQRRRHH